jgi:hypothetical protein
MASILEALGIEIYYDNDGNLIGLLYNDKTGSEDYFFSCFAGFVKDESYICMKGEENEDYYRYIFKGGKMYLQRAEVIVKYDEENEEVYEFGKMSVSDTALAKWKEDLDKRREEELKNG